jgi:hypothetical protein
MLPSTVGEEVPVGATLTVIVGEAPALDVELDVELCVIAGGWLFARSAKCLVRPGRCRWWMTVVEMMVRHANVSNGILLHD